MGKSILAISGSTRENSSNDIILDEIGKICGSGIQFEKYNKLDQLPHFNPDLDHDHVHKNIVEVRDKIEKADGIMICTPEYVFSLPGSLKNLLEWLVSTMLFNEKPVAFIVASAHGEKAFESLELILRTLGARVNNQHKLLIQGIKGKMHQNTGITDEKTFIKLKQLTGDFINIM